MTRTKLVDYVEDFSTNWRPLAASGIGLGSGLALQSFVMSIFAPHLLQSTGWSKADFALTGVFAGLVILTIPIVGRIVDLFGVRRIAAIGVVATPICFLAISRLDGPIWHYLLVMLILMTLGVTTTATVYTRPIVKNFNRTRGGALALVTSVPPLVAALGGPLIIMLNASYGWRTGLASVALYMAIMGMIAIFLLPFDDDKSSLARSNKIGLRGQKGDYRAIFSSRTFWLLFFATFLVSLPQVLTNSQLALVVIESGANAVTAGSIVSVFAIGAIFGRILAGLALDRFPVERVAAIGLSLPGLGMFMLASSLDHPVALGMSMLLVGLAFGAEGDVLAYLVVRHFGIRIYSSVTGLVFAAIGVAATIGSIALNRSISLTGGYDAFLITAGVGVLLGSLLFLKLKGHPLAEEAPN